MKEKWKQIDGFSKYEVSTLGRVRHLVNGIISQTTKQSNRGYLSVQIYNDQGKKVNKKVHRLVAETFIPNPCNKPQVNHIDEVNTNNEVKNLEWCTNLENMRHGTTIERRTKKKYKPIRAICIETGKYQDFESIKEMIRVLELTKSGSPVTAVLKGYRKHHKGYTFELL